MEQWPNCGFLVSDSLEKHLTTPVASTLDFGGASTAAEVLRPISGHREIWQLSRVFFCQSQLVQARLVDTLTRIEASLARIGRASWESKNATSPKMFCGVYGLAPPHL